MIVSGADDVAGAEIYLLSLLEGLRDDVAIEVVVGDRAPVEMRRRCQEAGVTVTTVRGLARRPSAFAAARLARVLRTRRPAIVHANLSDQGDGLATIAAATIARVPLCATLHVVLPSRRSALEALSRQALRRAVGVLGVSDAVGEYLADLGVRSTVVENGVAPTSAAPDARRVLELSPGELVIGGVGRLDRQKGWDVLCAAAPIVAADLPGVRFVVVGDGPERDRLLVCAGASHVRFVGYRERASSLMSAFDVLVVPSRYEGFGLVAVEAMLAGVPVVAARAGPLSDVVGDAGLLVDVDAPEALAEALLSLARSPRLRAELAERGRLRARERFGIERMGRETLAFWRQAAADAGVPWGP